MAKNPTSLDIQKEITLLRKHPEFGQWLQSAFQRVEDAVNTLATNTAVAAKGKLPPPPKVQTLNVKANDGMVHVTIDDTNPIQRGINYFVEHDTDPNFTRPLPVALNASRQATINLPAMDDDGNPQQFYFRAYSQYRGSDPGPPIHFGGNVPTPVSPGGNVRLTLLRSTGSGTAQNSGEQGGSGLGKVLFRPSGGPKRAIKA